MKRYKAIMDQNYKASNIEIYIEKGEIWNHMGLAPGGRVVIYRDNVIITLQDDDIENYFERCEF